MPTSVGELQGVSLIMSGDHNMYQKSKSYLDDFECPRCGHCCPQQTEQEPVAWLSTDCIGERYLCFTKPKDNDPVQPLYTTQPKAAEWVGLTAPEVQECYDLNPARFASRIEAKLKEKNNG